MIKIDQAQKKCIDKFWTEYGAYAVRDFKKDGYHYDKKPLESAVIRIVAEQIKKTKKEMIEKVESFHEKSGEDLCAWENFDEWKELIKYLEEN